MASQRRSAGRRVRAAAVTPAPDPPAVLLRKARELQALLTRKTDLGDIEALLDGLRRHRLFGDLAALGTAFCGQAPDPSPKAMRLTAQGLIERGRFREAGRLLRTIVEEGGDQAEALEAEGLLGRIGKQLYVNQAMAGSPPDASDLRRAIDCYLAAYDRNPSRPAWHGVNAVALLHRARRDAVKRAPLDRLEGIARAVASALTARYSDAMDYWDLATIAECRLALGQDDQAELWFHRAAWHGSANPFSLASTIRQLREVWLLSPDAAPGSRILPVLEARLRLEGGTQMATPASLAQARPGRPGAERPGSERLEKVFGQSPFMSVDAWREGLRCARAVCRVESRLNEGVGTGFVLAGRRLSSRLPDRGVMVTNAHVLSPGGDGESLTPDGAQATFYATQDDGRRPHRSRVTRILWHSPPDRLDTTVAELSSLPKIDRPLEISRSLPALGQAPRPRVYVIGHPNGGGLMFSLNDNELLDHGTPDDPRVHYRTPTEPGSSGSPVFNAQWQVIALHHAGDAALPKIHGGGTYEANEGLAFKNILEAVEADLSSRRGGPDRGRR